MDLSEGNRVLVELGDGSTIVAVIEGAADESLDLRLLDDLPESDVAAATVVGLLLVDTAGLHRWPARASTAPTGDTTTVQVTGAERVLQRRLHPRYVVDLPATVCRLRGSQSSRSQPGKVIDLSRGGIKVMAGPMDIGDTVLITVDIRTEPLELVGRVLLAYLDDQGNRVAHIAFLAPAGPSEPSKQFDDYLDSLIASEAAATGA